MPKRILLLAATCAVALATFAQCSGGGSSGGGGSEQFQLSARDVAPGQHLTVSHSTLMAGSTVRVTLAGANGYSVTASLPVVEAGRARLFAPPFLDFGASSAAAAWAAGDVSVTVEGLAGARPLHIQALPAIPDAAPGEILRVILALAIENEQSARQAYANAATEYGLDVAALLANLDFQIAAQTAMDAELAAQQQVSVEMTSGQPYVLKGAELANAERFAYAALTGLGAAIGATPDTGALRTPVVSGTAMTQQAAQVLRPTFQAMKNSVPAMQALGSFAGVLIGVGALGLGMAGAPVAAPTGMLSLSPAAVAGLMSAACLVTATAGAGIVAGIAEFGLARAAGKSQSSSELIGWAKAMKVLEEGAIGLFVNAYTGALMSWHAIEKLAEVSKLAYEAAKLNKEVRDTICEGQKHETRLSLRALPPTATTSATTSVSTFCDETDGCCVLPAVPSLGPDGGGGAGADGGADGGWDGGSDAGTDGGTDAGSDGGTDAGTGGSDTCGVAGDWTMACPDEVCASGSGGYPAATGAFSITPAVAAAGGPTTPSVGYVGFIGVFDVARCSLVLDMANLGSLMPPDNPCPLPPVSVIALRDGNGAGRIPFQEWGETECRCSELLPLPCTFTRQ